MTKKLHLICNSHIDPVWQWDWNEGLSAAISTFYQAVKFADEFDYVFCHGESILYEFIERNDPKLFGEIKRLVELGKWHIMGGWYIQPDCNGLYGESYVRQIETGRKYFKEKFGVTPKIAINFDSFGHSTGMPQILSKTGHDGYLFCRPMKHEQKFDMREFVWVSKDGSKIKAARAEDECVYVSRFGRALEDIKRKADNYKDLEVGVALWGVGNHGGINSRKDLEEVTKLMKEEKGFEIVHSTPEQYFNDINPKFEYEGPVQPKIIGSYTSMNRIKGLNAELERKLFNLEKMLSIAEIGYGYKPNQERLEDATKAMLKIQFHDALAGTVCPDAEKTTIEIGKGALATLESIETEAYLSIVSHEKQAKPIENPVFLFNFLPYRKRMLCETEIFLMDGLLSNTEELYLRAFQNGVELKTQRIKELGNINFDRKLRVAFYADLEPLNTTRIDFIVDKRPRTVKKELDGDYVFENEHMKVRINSKTGLLDSYIVDGREMLEGGAFEPILSVSSENPWGHDLERTTTDKVPFNLSTCDHGLTRGLRQMKVAEDGELFTEIQSVFERDDNLVILTYRVPKEERYIDVKAVVFHNAKNSAIEFKIPASFDGKHFGQVAYSTEYFEKDNTDKPTHRFIGLEDRDKALAVFSDSTYCSIAEGKNLYLLALNGAAYCAHLVPDRPLINEPDRYVPYIEQGRHEFKFRMSFENVSALESMADEFLNTPYGFNTYPHGDGNVIGNLIEISNRDIALKAFYKESGHHVIRLINNSNKQLPCELKAKGYKLTLDFNRYEVKTIVLDESGIRERREFISE